MHPIQGREAGRGMAGGRKRWLIYLSSYSELGTFMDSVFHIPDIYFTLIMGQGFWHIIYLPHLTCRGACGVSMIIKPVFHTNRKLRFRHKMIYPWNLNLSLFDFKACLFHPPIQRVSVNKRSLFHNITGRALNLISFSFQNSRFTSRTPSVEERFNCLPRSWKHSEVTIPPASHYASSFFLSYFFSLLGLGDLG